MINQFISVDKYRHTHGHTDQHGFKAVIIQICCLHLHRKLATENKNFAAAVTFLFILNTLKDQQKRLYSGGMFQYEAAYFGLTMDLT